MAFSSAGLQGAIIAGPALGGFVYVAGAAVVYGLRARCSRWRPRCACASATPPRRRASR